ncbi:unnamed protein product [Spirodela intermedia]|uniref:Ubiquitin carboxyl-terminal hydrolase n=1 Tax=Spirodela intermedia TaxID=51605 RepID=A0A7I8IN97_SPIIN|nr:unnamed protein product [Spirodela intermedia]CAA6658446.1 unnamed protein product [Spirodela intermedia]
MRDSGLDEVAASASDPDRPPCSPPPSTTPLQPPFVAGEDSDDDKVYIVPYRWLWEAWESSSAGTDSSTAGRGILYAASSVSSSYRGAMKLINNFFSSDLVFGLRREDNSKHNEAEAAASGRSYALVRTDMWSRALRWHHESNAAMKAAVNIFSVCEDNEVDTYALNLRISVARETDMMTVKIRNSVENYKRASKIFNIDSEMVHIWDFSGQTTLIFMNERNKVHQNCQRHTDQENLLEIYVYGLIETLICQTEPKKDELTVQQLKRTREMDSDSALLNGYSRCGSLDSLGLTGLENLGNTCFMNSAIQCLAHTPMLVEYFLGDYSKEINSQNPLGMDGELALAFGELLRKLWASGKTPVVPKLFKAKLARFAPQFSGFNQHDSQELLAFLLDGLHEDLNRVKCKRYVEVKDALDRPDEEVADEYWENHLARNNSIIVDICQGQYRSTLVCPICKKISVTFDPFMYLSLPLPSTTMRTMTVTVFSADGSAKPYPHTVTVPKHGKCRDIIDSLAVACSLKDDESLLLAEVYNNRIIRYLDDLSDSISLVRDEDRLSAYRLVKDLNKGPIIVFMHQREIPLVSKLSDDASGSAIQNLFLELTNPFLKSSGDLLDMGKNDQGYCNGEVDDVDTRSPLPECTSAVEVVDVGSCAGSKLLFYITDQKGQAMQSQIEIDEIISSADSQKELYVLVCWSDEIIKRYDAQLLGSLPEVRKSGLLRRQPQETISLYSCLEAFLKEEPLGPEDMWYCPSCKVHQQASKKLDLWRLPEILVIHLKRFPTAASQKNKLETVVDFPIHDLDLSSYVARKNGQDPYIYALFAVSNHYGSMGGGHYTAFVHHAGQNRWFDFDDRSVVPMAEGGVKSSAAYVLFYKKVPAAVPGS